MKKNSVLFQCIAILIVLVFLSAMISENDKQAVEELKIEEIALTLSSDAYHNLKYTEVEELFIDAGFTNVKIEESKNLTTDLKERIDFVSLVTINGNLNFKIGDLYPKNAPIIVTYNTLADIPVPSNSKDYVGLIYGESYNNFKRMGFTDVELKPVFNSSPSTVENAIVEVTIDGEDFELGQEFSSDSKVLIKFAKIDIYTVKNCKDLKEVLASSKVTVINDFAKEYYGEKIRFEGNISHVLNHGDYNTRYDILINAGDYSETESHGPSFQFSNVNYYDLNIVGNNKPSEIYIGQNYLITAEVGRYNSDNGLFQLIPISLELR